MVTIEEEFRKHRGESVEFWLSQTIGETDIEGFIKVYQDFRKKISPKRCVFCGEILDDPRSEVCGECHREEMGEYKD